MRILALLFLLPLTCFGQGFSDASAPFLLSTSSLRKGLVGYWRLEEASTRYDCSSSGNHLTPTGTVGSSTGIVQNCANFSGSTLLAKASPANVGFSTGQWTATAWVNLSNLNNGFVVGKWNATGGQRSWAIILTSSQWALQKSPDGASTSTIIDSATPAIVTNQWYFVVAGATSSTNYVWVDNAYWFGTPSGAVFNSSADLTIGARADNSLNITAKIDEVGIWNRALTTNELTLLYNAGLGNHFPFSHR